MGNHYKMDGKAGTGNDNDDNFWAETHRNMLIWIDGYKLGQDNDSSEDGGNIHGCSDDCGLV